MSEKWKHRVFIARIKRLIRENHDLLVAIAESDKKKP
jgi:hypothetical protein